MKWFSKRSGRRQDSESRDPQFFPGSHQWVVTKLPDGPPGTILKFSIEYEDGDNEELVCNMLHKLRFEDKTFLVEYNFEMERVVRPAAKKYVLAKLAKEKEADVKSRVSASVEYIQSATIGKGVCVTKNNVSEVFLLASDSSD